MSLMEDLEAKSTPHDHYLPPKKRKRFQEPKSKPSLVEETRKMTATLIEDLEMKNGPQDPDLTTQRKIFQEPSKTNQVEEETRKTTAATSGGNCSRRYCSIEDLEAENSPQDPDLTFKKRKTFQESKEETRKTTIAATSSGDRSHHNRPVVVLRKKLCKTDVDPNQNRLQHSEKEVKQVLLNMMTAEEKQLATQDGAGDGLRVTVLDRLGRVYHMNFKILHSKKYFRFRGSDYQKFVKDNNLKAGEVFDTWASRVKLRGGGRMREEGAGGIMDGQLLLLMLNYEADCYQDNYSK